MIPKIISDNIRTLDILNCALKDAEEKPKGNLGARIVVLRFADTEGSLEIGDLVELFENLKQADPNKSLNAKTVAEISARLEKLQAIANRIGKTEIDEPITTTRMSSGGFKNRLIDKAHWEKTLERLPDQGMQWVEYVKEFLKDENFIFGQKKYTYDQGFEDTFGVGFLSTFHHGARDKEFLDYLNDTYKEEIAIVRELKLGQLDFTDGKTRFANSEIFWLFNLSNKHPTKKFLTLLREIYLNELYNWEEQYNKIEEKQI